ncbi:hypothetical protein BRARA_A02092 [Brassica rapa]|uniref:S-acyltransferase n=2 Tax=Brassica campestris TaxID=3711 RepID=M4FCS7_BRACM|nr:protein S-acyltransferase 10 isoform X1 [Brassica rapa]KAG5415121.1 hypothetical protein IGI04_002688 [Brassica rapa subsp. trilocularis]RID79347.1 hypothetical protein BRARA_A02092 [Brassica rapa]
MGVCCPVIRTRDRLLLNLPCLSDPVGRSSLFLKLALVALHLVFIGFLLVCDAQFIEKTRLHPWYMSSYFFFFSATLVQYFVTSGSSPGYVIDAMRDVDETNAIMYRNAPTTSFEGIQHASRKTGSVVITVEGESASGGRRTPSSWQKMVMDLYPPGTSLRNLTCGYCHVEQPPRAKHCHDCDRCVLQFDHHCVWLGTCVGQKNHSKFWWYICEESALSIWTLIMYIDFLTNVAKPWWKNAIIILLLVVLVISLIFVLLLLLFHSYLILTNQSTYELVRRKRIPYMRNMPERVHPFSRGIKRNLYNVCCGNDTLDSLPTAYELEDRSRSYTCLDMLKCRCC